MSISTLPWGANVAALGGQLTALLLPRDCFLCDAPSKNHFLCPACENALPRLPSAHCNVCARPLVRSETCGACLKLPPAYDTTHAAFMYSFPLDSLIQSLKYQRRLASATYLSQALISLVGATRPDLVVPVPLAPARLAVRGFNQAIELAGPLAKYLKVPMPRSNVLRCRDTLPQVSLPRKDRASNIRDAFECRADLSGRTVWVVDDVMTTGATLNEIARVLKAHGALRVENFVVARAGD